VLVGVALAASCFVSAASAAAPCSAPPAGGGEWPSYGHDVANTRTQPEPNGFGPSAVAQLKPAWVFSTSSTGDGTGFNTTPVTYGGCVFIGSFGGVAYALDAKSGHVVWRRTLESSQTRVRRRDRRFRAPATAISPTIRVSGDHFGREKWDTFLYTSRLASALGIWPWCDVFMSRQTDNLLLATLSAGMVGIGDRIAAEDKKNLLHAVRTDGVIVKPDTPLVPLDAMYTAGSRRPMIAAAHTDHGALRTGYCLQLRPRIRSGERRFHSRSGGSAA